MRDSVLKTFKQVNFGYADKKRLFSLLTVLALLWLPSLTGPNMVQWAASLYPVAASNDAYFILDNLFRLYLWMPIVVVSACVLFLSPGLLLSIATNSAKNISQLILTGFALSVVLISTAGGVVQSIAGVSLRGEGFAAVVVIVSLLCFGVLLIRATTDNRLTWPFAEQHGTAKLVSFMAVSFLFVALLVPKIFWDNFNEDGAHAFEATRLLLVQPLPFWDPASGPVSAFPGITTMLFVFPASWFMRLFGEFEASVRLPYVLYLTALAGAVISLIEVNRKQGVRFIEASLIWVGLSIYSVVVIFSATYNPYNSDIALPATQDTLLMLCYLGFVFYFIKKQYVWAGIFFILTYLSSPGGLLLVGLWLLATVIIWRPVPWRSVMTVAGAIAGIKMISIVTPGIMKLLSLPPPGSEHSTFEMIKKLRYIQFSDLRRFLYLIVPGGILPAFSLWWWRGQDYIARTLTILVIMYFTFFYVTAYVSLHYFVPVMIFPIIVFWRSTLAASINFKKAALMCYALTGVVAFLISLPVNFRIHTTARMIGESIEDKIGGYEKLDPDAFRLSDMMLSCLFPPTWEPEVPHKSYGGSPLQWYYYAHHKADMNMSSNYVIQPSKYPYPDNMHLICDGDGAALFVRHRSIWESHRALRPPTPAESPIYAIERDLLFRGRPVKTGLTIIDLKELFKKFTVKAKDEVNSHAKK